MKQAQMLQQSFEDNKNKLKNETATASVGGNMVTATVDGEKVLKEIKIDFQEPLFADPRIFKTIQFVFHH